MMIKGPLLIARYPGDSRIAKQIADAKLRLVTESFRNAKPIVTQASLAAQSKKEEV